MPALTEEEKVRGRQFRDEQQAKLDALNEADPCDYYPPNFLSIYRHNCERRGGISTALNLHEVYVYSDDGRLAWLYKQGKCGSCGQTARSKTGKVKDAHERAPMEGRVAR